MAAINRELQSRSKQLSERLSESLYILDHDPSMALYRIQEHTNKVAPKLVVRRQQMSQLNSQIQGACFDLDNAIKTVDQMKTAQSSLERIKKILIGENGGNQQ
uniref:BLOC-1-related complex subunit 7 n=1 Tax=Meloidogyne incognita TaxID=6306 RepID=A0A914LEL1_MELIC